VPAHANGVGAGVGAAVVGACVGAGVGGGVGEFPTTQWKNSVTTKRMKLPQDNTDPANLAYNKLH